MTHSSCSRQFLPENVNRPFVAYGIFKPGQIAYCQLKDFVDCAAKVAVPGSLRLRDGVVLFDKRIKDGPVDAFRLSFLSGLEQQAYAVISDMEPSNLFYWDSVEIDGEVCNILSGKKIDRGSHEIDMQEYIDIWNDPTFNDALEVVENELSGKPNECWDMKAFFKLQMSYLLLWSALERFATLRYGFGQNPVKKIEMLARDKTFCASVGKHVSEKDPVKVFRTDDPEKNYVAKPDDPLSTIRAYYQLRSNITHRGKSYNKDYQRLFNSAKTMLLIFRDVLAASQQEASLDLENITSIHG